MIRLVTLLAFVTFGLNGLFAQKDKSKRKSPMENIEAKIGDANIKVQYSSPRKNNREIFGKLVPYGKVWRTGANEASVFETDKEIMFGDKKLAAGKYALFTIPGKKEWTIILNSDWEQWGAYKYKEKNDVLRITVPAGETKMETENFTILIVEGELHIRWDVTDVSIPLK